MRILKKHISILPFLLSLFFSSLYCLAQNADIVLKGKVFDQTSLSPIKNATVKVQDDARNIIVNTSTNSIGEFQFSINPANVNTFIINIHKGGYETSSSQFNLKNIIRLRQYVLQNIYLKPQEFNVGGPTPKKKIDTIPTGTFIKNKILQHRMYPNKDAFTLIYALNPQLDTVKQIPVNFRINYPTFPKLGKAQKKASRKQYKEMKKTSKSEAIVFSNNFRSFVELLSTLNSVDIGLFTPISKRDLVQLKDSLNELKSAFSVFESEVRNTSKGVLLLVNKEVSILNQTLRETITSKSLNEGGLKTFEALINNLGLTIDQRHVFTNPFYNETKSLYAENFTSQNTNRHSTTFFHLLMGSIALFQDFSVKSNYSENLLSNPAAPQLFDINVYPCDSVNETCAAMPDMNRYHIDYFPPGLPQIVTSINLPASTSWATIAPANFKFILTDQFHPNKTYESTVTIDQAMLNGMGSCGLFKRIFGRCYYHLIFNINR